MATTWRGNMHPSIFRETQTDTKCNKLNAFEQLVAPVSETVQLEFMANTLDVATKNDLKYQFYPVSSTSVKFNVRAANDAHVALTAGPQESDPMVEIIIGGWSNKKSVIRRNRTKPDKFEADTPDILHESEDRGFWLRWEGGNISAGREGESTPFVSWKDPEPFSISFLGVRTGWGATGSWKIELPTSAAPVSALASSTPAGSAWVDAARGQVPPGAVVGGRDTSGEPLYVARANHKGTMIPGKLVASHGCVYVPWDGAEHAKPEYQVLVGGPNKWVKAKGSNIPPGAFAGGEDKKGEPLFIGRVQHEGSITTGKVQQSHGVCYIAFGGKELSFPEYEILVS